MTLGPESGHGSTDSPAGRDPAGKPGVDRTPADQTSSTVPMSAAPDAAPPESGYAVPTWPSHPWTSGLLESSASTGQSAPPESAEPPQRWPGRARLGFRGWRRSRPFWGGLFVLLGGGEIIFTYKAPMALVMHFGLYGLAGYLVPGLMVLLGLLLLFDPQHRTFYSVLAVLAALGTWLTSNLGGFILGMLFGLIGGSLAFGWQAGPKPVRKRPRRYRPTPTH